MLVCCLVIFFIFEVCGWREAFNLLWCNPNSLSRDLLLSSKDAPDAKPFAEEVRLERVLVCFGTVIR